MSSLCPRILGHENSTKHIKFCYFPTFVDLQVIVSSHVPSYKEIQTGSIFSTSNTPTHNVLGNYSGKIPLNGKVDVTYEEAYLRGRYVTIVNENRTPLSLQEVRVYGTKDVGEVVYNIGYLTDKGQHQFN